MFMDNKENNIKVIENKVKKDLKNNNECLEYLKTILTNSILISTSNKKHIDIIIKKYNNIYDIDIKLKHKHIDNILKVIRFINLNKYELNIFLNICNNILDSYNLKIINKFNIVLECFYNDSNLNNNQINELCNYFYKDYNLLNDYEYLNILGLLQDKENIKISKSLQIIMD